MSQFFASATASIRHVAHGQTYEAAATSRPSYENTFTTMPATTPATPHRTIPRPKVSGSQIALIAGPSGEEIYTEQYGRVKVWFPWDRRAKKDGSDTIWIRVGQPWAGTTWGHQVIPRVGMEALISYQEGDPDRPFVTALVPDPTNPTPYPLPDNKTRMTFRSNSYKSSGFNEMTFEDATGAENMFFHAQKDHTTKIENNQTLSVGASQASVVGKNQSVTVGQNMTFEAGKSINFTIGGTGAGAAALMAPFTGTGIAAMTANLLGQGLSCAAEPSGEHGDLVQQLSSVAGTLAGGAMTLGPNLAGSLIGLLNQTGIQAQQNVWNGPSPRPDAGTALAAAGNLFGEAVGALFNVPGVHNHITGMMKADHVGCARVEQVGTAKVTNVGATFGTKVGKTWSLVAGKDAFTTVGNDWGVASKRRSSIKAGENIMLQADHSISAIADDSVYIAAKDQVTISGRLVTISAQDQIILQVGENASFVLDSSGLIYSGSSSDIVLDAATKVWLQGSKAKVTVGPDQSLANPPMDPGNLGVMASLVKMLPLAGKNKIKKEITDRLGKQLDKTPEGKKINEIVDQFLKDLKDSLADPPAASP